MSRQYLIQKDGRVYDWSEVLAARDDMRIADSEDLRRVGFKTPPIIKPTHIEKPSPLVVKNLNKRADAKVEAKIFPKEPENFEDVPGIDRVEIALPKTMDVLAGLRTKKELTKLADKHGITLDLSFSIPTLRDELLEKLPETLG